MDLNSVDVSVGAWEGDAHERLTFPEDWEITVSHMVGHELTPLTDEDIKYAILNPLGVSRLSDLIAGKRKVAIIFDDLTRPTPAYRILPFLLEEIHSTGIREHQISFVAALGAHRPMIRKEFCSKLGTNVVQKYQIFNHNMSENLVDAGVTPLGIRLYINRE
ncbi:lactate racemase domain-containing protein, partial [Chloroflexota bacterium]